MSYPSIESYMSLMSGISSVHVSMPVVSYNVPSDTNRSQMSHMPYVPYTQPMLHMPYMAYMPYLPCVPCVPYMSLEN